MQGSTIAAIATAPGAGGIAVVRLSGPRSYQVAEQVFRPANAAKSVAQAKGYTALFGSFVEGDEAFDQGVALFFRAPHSYTGEDVAEFCCHGGEFVLSQVLAAVIAAGARPVLTAFVEEVNRRGLKDVVVTQAGCIGMCKLEPIVEVFQPGKEKVTYVKMTPEKVSRIVTEHLVNGSPVTEYTVGAYME